MNAPFKPSTERDRVETEINRTTAAAQAAFAYATILAKEGKFSDRTELARLSVARSIIALFDDGDALTVRDLIMGELGVDEHGNPETAVPYVERLSVGMVGAVR